MISFFQKPYRWARLFSVTLALAFGFALLDAFIIPKTYAIIEPTPISLTSAQPREEFSTERVSGENLTYEAGAEIEVTPIIAETEPIITENSYSDENINITIETVVKYDTTFYVADIQVSDPQYLKTALANNTYGRNIKATTSEMATENNAILAINGDYYGFRDTGYVLRNGVLYRDTESGDALVIDNSGNFLSTDQSAITDDIVSNAWQIFSFGPPLVENSQVAVNSSSEVSKSKTSNPRTAIGQIGDGHYIVIVSDGRTGDSEGLSLLQLAEEFVERGATTAYNLDGGGSSTMVFNGQLINMPTSGKSNSEREVSDIVYFGY